MMKPKLDAWTIVVAGAWNVRVFSPEWVGKKLFDGKSMTIEVPVGPSIATVRYTVEGISLLPVEDRLIMGILGPDLPSCQRAEGATRRVLGLLPHTPVTALGVNFGFEDPEPGDPIRSLFMLNDLDPLSNFGCKIKRSSIVRTLETDEGSVNVTHALDGDGRADIHFNFHHDVVSADEAERLLEGRTVRALMLAQKFMTKVYDCTLEEIDDQST